MTEVRAEIDEVLGPAQAEARAPTYEEIQKLELTRLCLAEALRLYPEPPILIRRCLEDVPLPKRRGRERRDAHQRHGRVHLGVEPAQAPRLLGRAAQVRP